MGDALSAPLTRVVAACIALMQHGVTTTMALGGDTDGPSPALWRRCLQAVQLDADQARALPFFHASIDAVTVRWGCCPGMMSAVDRSAAAAVCAASHTLPAAPSMRWCLRALLSVTRSRAAVCHASRAAVRHALRAAVQTQRLLTARAKSLEYLATAFNDRKRVTLSTVAALLQSPGDGADLDAAGALRMRLLEGAGAFPVLQLDREAERHVRAPAPVSFTSDEVCSGARFCDIASFLWKGGVPTATVRDETGADQASPAFLHRRDLIRSKPLQVPRNIPTHAHAQRSRTALTARRTVFVDHPLAAAPPAALQRNGIDPKTAKALIPKHQTASARCGVTSCTSQLLLTTKGLDRMQVGVMRDALRKGRDWASELCHFVLIQVRLQDQKDKYR